MELPIPLIRRLKSFCAHHGVGYGPVVEPAIEARLAGFYVVDKTSGSGGLVGPDPALALLAGHDLSPAGPAGQEQDAA